MSVSIMTQNGILEVPTRGGGINTLDKISKLESEIEQIKEELKKKISSEKITTNGNVTEEGYVSDARILNPSISGTLANTVESLKSNVDSGFGIRQITQVEVYSDVVIEPGQWKEFTVDISSKKFKKIPFASIRQLTWYSVHSINFIDVNTMSVIIINPYDVGQKDWVSITLIEPL